jgi:hypothetical protein
MFKKISITLLLIFIIFGCKQNSLLDNLFSKNYLVMPASITLSNPFTEAVTSFAIHNSALYAGTKNTTSGAEVYKYSGSVMEKVLDPTTAFFIGEGWGGAFQYISSMYSFGSQLYVGVYNAVNGTRVYRTTDSSVIPHVWELVYSNVPPFNAAGAMTSFSGELYIGISSFDTGAVGTEKVRIYKSATGAAPWTDVTGGWGLYNNEIAGFAIYEGMLFIATIKQSNNYGDGAELWFYNGAVWSARVDSDTGTAVFGGGFGYPHPNQLPKNMGLASLGIDSGYLYIGVKNLTAAGMADTGCKVWRTNNTSNYTSYLELMSTGFGDINNVSVDTIIPYGGYVYVLTRNSITGTQMWRTSSASPLSWTKVNTDGFGDSLNVSGRAAIVFNTRLYIGLEKSTGANATVIEYGVAP